MQDIELAIESRKELLSVLKYELERTQERIDQTERELDDLYWHYRQRLTYES